MFKTYLKSAWRNLQRNRLFSFINIFGLALSMSVCLIILHHFRDQLSYDNFHNGCDRMGRVITELHNADGREFRLASTPMPLGTAIRKSYPLIEAVTQIYPVGTQKLALSKKHLQLRSAFTDNYFLKIFNFKLRSGSRNDLMNAPDNILLTATAAKKLFGSEDPVNQVVSYEKLGDFKVAGIIDDSVQKSHIDFEAYLPLTAVPALEKNGILAANLETWNGWTNAYTYVRVKEGQTQFALEAALNSITNELKSDSKLNGKENIHFQVQPFDKIIIGEELGYAIGNVGSKSKTAAELLIGFVILLSACFNYTNLSIARSLKRGREVGVRKIAGALRWEVFYQFIIESVINAFIAFLLSYFILGLLIEYAPFIAGGISRTLIFDDPVLLLWFIVFALFTGLLAGVLPAWALSSFKPVDILKNLSQVKLFGGIGLRKSLIVFQFALALLITIFSGIFSKQFEHMATADPGYSRDNLFAVQLQSSDVAYLKQEVYGLNGVKDISAISKTFGRGSSGKTAVRFDDKKDALVVDHYDADSNFITVAGLKLLAGNGFRNESVKDESQVIINESLAKVMNLKSPVEAIGKSLIIDDSVHVSVAGVLRDFHYAGMEFPVWPLMIRNRSAELTVLEVKTNQQTPLLESGVRQIWKRINPAAPFESYWLRTKLYEQQSANDTTAGLNFLAFMTIVIAVLGLLGMVVYTTQTREKEIGIRKIMGADVRAIMMLLSKGFVKLVMIAGLIAIPLSYIGAYFFLNMFATRISMGFGLMLGSLGVMIFVTLVVILSQVYKVAVENPVKSLRMD